MLLRHMFHKENRRALRFPVAFDKMRRGEENGIDFSTKKC